MLGLAILRANDIWAVGFTTNPPGNDSALIDHWDGKSWTAYPGAPANAALLEASVLPDGRIWAVGQGYVGTQGHTQNLAMLFDGTTWKVVPTPNSSPIQNVLRGLVTISSTDVWTVGFARVNGSRMAQSLHWDGRVWNLVPVDVPTGGDTRLRRIDALSPSDIWTVGNSPGGPFIEHWDGRAWSRVAAALDDAAPFRVKALDESTIWISGASKNLQRLCPVQVTDTGYRPTRTIAEQGQPTSWHVPLASTATHRVTDGTGLGLFDSGPLTPGGSYVVALAGAGRFDVRDGVTGGTAELSVPVDVAPMSGVPATSFTITSATTEFPANLVEDVRIKRPGSNGFAPWLTMTSATGFRAAFIPDAGAGTYLFTSSARNPATGATSRLSPATAITVNGARR